MFNAQFLFGGSTATKVYSPWFRRRGDNLIGTAELVDESGGTLKVRVFHKALEDMGDGVDADTGAVITLSGSDTREYEEWAGLEELVRYQFECSGTASQWVLFRMLAPVWFDSAKV